MHLKPFFTRLLAVFIFYGYGVKCHFHNIRKPHPPNQQLNNQDENLIIQTTRGQVIGKIDQTESGTKYYAFQGIPYAKPPVNELRFEAPKVFSWNGIWNATYQRNECVQAFDGFLLPIQGREDCLYLNINTRKTKMNPSNLKPVMVWIYGGNFLFGSGNKQIYSPEYFIEKDVVVITFNYRLGVFGFLSTGDEVVPGNNGLKDQILALKWIKDNIASFGGNPEMVTIMGESAGGVSVGHLIQSQAANGLFQRGILQSGTSIIGLVPAEKMRRGVRRLGEAFGVKSGINSEIVAKLKTVDYASLLLYSVVVAEQIQESLFDSRLFAPVLERKSKNAVLTKPPYHQLEACDFNSVPVIVGFNSEEALVYQQLLEEKKYTYIIYDQNPAYLLSKDLDVTNGCNATQIGMQVKERYTGSEGFVFSKTGLMRYFSDEFFMKSATFYSVAYSKCNNVFLYRFSYTANKTLAGAGHADELRYLFPTFPVDTQRTPLSAEEEIVKENMVSLWSDFMKFGNPTPASSNFGIKWNTALPINGYEYMDISEKLKVGSIRNSPFKSDYDFWKTIYNTCGLASQA